MTMNVSPRLSAEQEAVPGGGSAGQGLEVLQREHRERQRRPVTLARAVPELALAPPAARVTCVTRDTCDQVTCPGRGSSRTPSSRGRSPGSHRARPRSLI